MREIFTINAAIIKSKIHDSIRDRFKKSFIASGSINQYLNKAVDCFYHNADPLGILCDISCKQFKSIYRGDGCNEQETPLDDILNKEPTCALFSITIGSGVSREVTDLFRRGDSLVGYLLDMISSSVIEEWADLVTEQYLRRGATEGWLNAGDIAIRYSPGYCGWHISGQRLLHKYLNSREIGISLTKNYCMDPLKSISGVIVGGSYAKHYFNNDYLFCRECPNISCRERLRIASNGLRNKPPLDAWADRKR